MLSECCCFRLRTGGLVIGWLGVFGSLYVERNAMVAMLPIFSKTEVPSYVWCGLAGPLISLVISVLLLVGIVLERHLLMIPWLVCAAISMIIVFNVILFALKSGSLSITFIALIGGGIALGLSFYFSYAIYSLYKEIQLKQNMKSDLTIV